MFRNLLRPRACPVAQRLSARPRLEALEDRTLPSSTGLLVAPVPETTQAQLSQVSSAASLTAQGFVTGSFSSYLAGVSSYLAAFNSASGAVQQQLQAVYYFDLLADYGTQGGAALKAGKTLPPAPYFSTGSGTSSGA